MRTSTTKPVADPKAVPAVKAVKRNRTKRMRSMGQAIKLARGTMSQADLGMALGDLPQTTISRWEGGLVEMSFEAVCELEAALGLNPGFLGAKAGYYVEAPKLTSAEILAAIREDEGLDPAFRETAANSYEGFLNASAARRPQRGRK